MGGRMWYHTAAFTLENAYFDVIDIDLLVGFYPEKKAREGA